MTNIYAVPMQVMEPKPRCGCVSVIEYTDKLNPQETGHIDIKVDTSLVEGYKAVKLPVEFRGRDPRRATSILDPKTGKPFYSTADLEIRLDQPAGDRGQARGVRVRPGAGRADGEPDGDDRVHRAAAGLEDPGGRRPQGSV